MTAQKTVISSHELQGILGNRVSLDYNPNQKRIQGKEINDKVIMQQKILHGSNTYIKPLTFDECIFNEEVNIGSYEDAGTVVLAVAGVQQKSARLGWCFLPPTDDVSTLSFLISL